MNGFYVKDAVCAGEPVFKKLYHKLFEHQNEADPCVAWALMREYLLKDDINMEADLMYIYTDVHGEGLGLELLNRIKDCYVAIRTQWSASTKQGRELCLKAGFVRDGDILIYKREVADALQIGCAKTEVSCNGEQGGNLQENGEGVGQEIKGKEIAGTQKE